MHLFRYAAWAIALGTLAVAIAAWGDLPERIPVHLGADGQPDGWARKGGVSWFALAAIGLLVQVLLTFVAAVVRRNPSAVNIPDKERLLEMPPRHQAPVLLAVQGLVDLLALAVAVLIAVIQWQFVEVAGGRAGIGALPLILAPAALLVVALAGVVRISGALDAAHRAWRQAGSPPD